MDINRINCCCKKAKVFPMVFHCTGFLVNQFAVLDSALCVLLFEYSNENPLSASADKGTARDHETWAVYPTLQGKCGTLHCRAEKFTLVVDADAYPTRRAPARREGDAEASDRCEPDAKGSGLTRRCRGCCRSSDAEGLRPTRKSCGCRRGSDAEGSGPTRR